MKTIESIVYPILRLFEAGDYSFLVNLKEGRHIFVSELSSCLLLTMASTCAAFKSIHQKSVSRAMD